MLHIKTDKKTEWLKVKITLKKIVKRTMVLKAKKKVVLKAE